MTTTLASPEELDDVDDRDDTVAGTDLELATLDVVDGELVDDEQTPLPVVAAPPSVRMELLDPHDLMDNPRNPRHTIGDLADLIASMRVVGVLEPLVLVDVGEPQFMLLMGHRRKYAAIEVGLAEVPCWIITDQGDVHQVLAQMLENTHRVGLTCSEQAESFHQLTLLGWTEQQIGQVRAISAAQVRRTLQVRELPEAAKQAIDNDQIDFVEAAALAEFEDTPAVYSKLVAEIGNRWRFQQALGAARASRAFTAAKDLAKANLVIDGVKVTSRPKGFGYDSTAVDVRQLVDADGNRLDPEQAKTMPGMAAFIERDGTGANTVVYCTDPGKYGYQRRTTPRPSWMSEEEAAQREAEEQARTLLREQLGEIAEARRDFVRATWGTAKAARALFVPALRATLLGQSMRRSDGLDSLYAGLGGADPDALTTAAEDKLRRTTVARWLCAMLSNLESAADQHAWVDEPLAVAFYDMLAGAGYPLSDAETRHYQALTRELAEPDDEQADEDEQPDEDEQLDGPDGYEADHPESPVNAADDDGDGDLSGPAEASMAA